jgi:membrane protease YdiL (CAAX protease family)
VAWHVPSILGGDSSRSGLWVVGGLGAVFSVARFGARRLEPPVLLHVAADLLGSRGRSWAAAQPGEAGTQHERAAAYRASASSRSAAWSTIGSG